MLVPINWLKDYVDINLKPEEFKNLLVSVGFEVEDIIYPKNQFSNIFSAKIISCKTHTNNTLICEVISYGSKSYTIVTNDITLSEGMTVPLAIEGAILSDGTKISGRKVFNTFSEGMFCGFLDLGLTQDDFPAIEPTQVVRLPSNINPGQNLNEMFSEGNYLLDIAITANRSDANSILGIAREISAITGSPLRNLPKSNINVNVDNSNTKIQCIIEDLNLCKRYLGCVVDNVLITESPDYIKNRLLSVGLRPINNIIDVTNYVLIATGQPMHAFDYESIEDNTIIVREAVDGENIKALDEKIYSLKPNMLAICNSSTPMAIAGIMGGYDFSVNDSTKKIVLESANFARENIRKTSRELGLISDSSLRFEKGIDLISQEIGMAMALDIILEHGWGDVSLFFDTLKSQPVQRIINFPLENIEKILGIYVSKHEIEDILCSLGFEFYFEDSLVSCTVPKWRDDVIGVNDIAEEIIRILGYDRFEQVINPSKSTVILGKVLPKQAIIDRIDSVLTGKGFFEIINYSFVPNDYLSVLSYEALSNNNTIEILNPLNEDYSVMRKTLSYSMIKAMQRNCLRGNTILKFFEIGKIYYKDDNDNKKTFEELRICIGSVTDNYYAFKNIIDNIFKVAHIPCNYRRSATPFLHPYRQAEIFDNRGNIIGYLGEIDSSVAKSLDIEQKSYIAEINLEYIVSNYCEYLGFKPISKYQSSERDIAIVVHKDVEVSKVISTINKIQSNILYSSHVFDVYYGEQIPENHKSLAIKLKFQSLTHTLTDNEIQNDLKVVVRELEDVFQAKHRTE